MSISTVRARLKTLQLAIPGISHSYAQLPKGMIKTSELPLFLNFARDSKYDYETFGSDDMGITRTFLMWLMVKPAAEGEEGEGESLVEPWIPIVTNFFNGRPSLGNLVGVQIARLTGDSGPKRMVWPGTPNAPQGVYWGAEFRLNVTEIVPINFAANE
jgi:hypothetical protein